MQFLFVDKIKAIEENKISGMLKLDQGPYLRQANGDKYISPGFISEAIGQLASWLCINKSGFEKKPVFLFCPEIRYEHIAPAGAEIELQAHVERMEEDSLVFSGEASHNGQLIASIRQCNCHLMPLAKLENPELIRERFSQLKSGTWQRQPGSGNERLDYSAVANESKDEWRIEISNAEFIYADHFPNYPVTPIVVINEIVQRILERELKFAPVATIKSLKIRNFILPNETFSLFARTLDHHEGRLSAVQVDIKKENKHVMRGVYEITR